MTAAPQEPHSARSQPPAEQALVDRARAGSLDAFSELVRLYQGRLFNFLRQRTGSDSDADDLAQEAFLRAWRHLDRYDPTWRFSTWLFTIASRLVVSHQRSISRRRETSLSTGLFEDVAERPEPGASGDGRSRRINIWALAAEHLGEIERTALWLRYAENMPAPEIARALDKSAVNVRVILHRARRRLARCLADRLPATGDDRAGQSALSAAALTCKIMGAETDV